MSPPADPETPPPGDGGSPEPAPPEPQAPLTLLLLQGQLVLVVAVEVAPEEEGEFGILLLLLHRHLLELGPVPRHKLRQLVDDIPQLLVCGKAAPSAPALPAPFSFPRSPPVPPEPPDRPSPSGGSGISMAPSPRAAGPRRTDGRAATPARPRFTAPPLWRRRAAPVTRGRSARGSNHESEWNNGCSA